MHFFIAAKRSTGDDEYRSITISLQSCYWSLLGQTGGKLPTTDRLRFTFAIWLMFGVIITTAYTANLKTFLSFDSYEKQISNVRDIIESDLQIGYHIGFAPGYVDSNVPEDQYIFSHHIDCDSGSYCFNRTAFDRRMAFIKLRKCVLQEANTYRSPDNHFSLHMCKDRVRNVLIQMAFAKGHPMLEVFNDLLLRIKSAGFVYHNWEQFEFWVRRTFASMSLSMRSEQISLADMLLPFAALALGKSISLIVFVIENLTYSYWQNLSTRKHK